MCFRPLALAAVVVMGLSLLVALLVVQARRLIETHGTIIPNVQARYGFQLGSPYVYDSDGFVEVTSFSVVTPGGVLASVGVTNGDVLRSHNGSSGALCRALDQSSGTRIVLEVVDGGAGAPLDRRPVRRITVTAP